MNFGEQDLGQRLQSWGKKEWNSKAVAQMHEKRHQRRRGSRGQTRHQWWKDRTSGKVAWGTKSYYNAPWNKNKNDSTDGKDGRDKDDKKDNNDGQDTKDDQQDTKDDKQDKNDKDASSELLVSHL